MRLKITLSLLAILMGLLAYIIYIEPTAEEDAFDTDRKNVLGELAVGIDYLSIHNSTTGQDITFEFQGKNWMLTSPYEWPANEFAIQKILTQLRFLERITSFETNIVSNTGVSLRDYGLAPPELSVVFGRGERRNNLGIGKITEIGNNLYILSVDQKRVHVVDRSLLDSLSANLSDLRSTRLFDTAVFEVTSWNIQVRDSVRNLRAWFTRTGDNWMFETPIRARADSAAVNTLLTRCLNLEAEEIVASNPSDLSPYGLQNTPYRIAIESGEKREVLEIGNRISEDSELRYAKRESRPTVFQVRIDFLELLENAQTKLRQRRIFELDVTDATTVTITRRDGNPLTLQKLEAGTWELVTRDSNQGIHTIKGDSQTIEEMLVWLDRLTAVPDTGFINDAPSAPDLESYGLEVPEYSITITSDKIYNQPLTLNTPESTTLLIGDKSDGDRQESYVKIANKDFVYSVYNDVFERVSESPDFYKSRRIVDLPSDSRISKIEVARISDGRTIASYDLDNKDDLDPQGEALAQSMKTLRAHSYNPEGFTSTVEIAGHLRPWAYTVTVTIAREESNSNAEPATMVFYVSETTGGPLLLGGILERNLGFRFPTEFIDAFSPIVFDRIPRERPEEPFSSTPIPQVESRDIDLPISGAAETLPQTIETAPEPDSLPEGN